MFKTLVVALDHAPDGDRSLRVAQALIDHGAKGAAVAAWTEGRGPEGEGP